MMRWLGLILFGFFIFGPAPIHARNTDATCDVKQILSAEELLLTDGIIVQLQGVACCLDPDDGHSAKVKNFLQVLVNGNRLTVEGDGIDLYGRKVGAVFTIDSSGKKIGCRAKC